MKRALYSRGPDDSGVLIKSGVGLVHTRLSIIDLSARAKCPMTTADGRYTLVYNGEIYNFKDIRNELSKRGHQFRTHGDTETLLLGYQEWGEAVFERLDGMFAFAIWDQRRQELALARDRMGEKPLYYCETESEFIFASTIAAILAGLEETPVVDFDALTCLLSHQFIPKNHCIFKGFRCLPAAHVMVYSPGRINRARPYWNLPLSVTADSLEDAALKTEDALVEAVKSRMVADVDVGGFLSGGIDSSLVMTLMARNSSRKVRTFSVGFAGEKMSELPYAQAVAEQIGSEHHEVRFQEDDVLRMLPELVWQFGEPFCDPAALPVYFLSAAAARSVKVCVGGDGGDEIFGGYSRIQRHLMSEKYQRLKPALLWKKLLPELMTASCKSGWLPPGVCSRFFNAKRLAVDQYPNGYANDFTWLNQLESVCHPQIKAHLKGTHRPETCYNLPMHSLSFGSDGRRYLYNEVKGLLPDDYLVKTDISSMASSLEVRSPYLAHRLVEVAWSLPVGYHISAFRTKILLKRIAVKYLSPKIALRKKMGLSIPLDPWFRRRLGALLEELFKDSALEKLNWINGGIVKAYYRRHCQGRENHGVRLWIILWLELWARIVLLKTMDRNYPLNSLLS
jgi:asparagine synthase (glutamine-hydrolysing)